VIPRAVKTERAARTTAAEEIELCQRIRRGDSKALDELITRNIPFAYWWARKFADCGIPLDELESIALEALVYAARLYRAEQSRFGTYASFWIRSRLGEAVAAKRLVHVPPNLRRSEPPEFIVPFHREGGEPIAPEEMLGVPGGQEHKLLEIEIERAMAARLHPREAEIIVSRFGLFGRERLTLKAIGKRLDLSRERIRQLESQAMDALRDYFGASAAA
jgi:RNA polymerase sigma factor (sigma-70 family)